MQLHSIFKVLSIVFYFFILLQGMMICVPFVLLLAFPFADTDPVRKILLIAADLCLIGLLILRFHKKLKASILTEVIIYFLMLSPLVKTIASFPLERFNYAPFLIPFFGFVVLFPLSVILSYIHYKRVP